MHFESVILIYILTNFGRNRFYLFLCLFSIAFAYIANMFWNQIKALNSWQFQWFVSSFTTTFVTAQQDQLDYWTLQMLQA